jgi:hypothetical protein
MNVLDQAAPLGQVFGTLIRADGTTETFHVNNTVVDAGKEIIADRISSLGTAYVTHMGIGTGSVEVAAGDTAITGAIARAAITPTSGLRNVTFASPVFTGNAAVISEIGLFTAVTAGTMVARALVGPFTVTAGDSLSFNWVITIT